MTEFHDWLKQLSQPEYIHVLLNPIPIYGTAAGMVALILSLFLRSRLAQCVAVVIIGLSCLAVWPVTEYGQRGFDRVKAMSNADAQSWLEAHEDRAEDMEPIFYATAGLCLAALLTPGRFPRARAMLMYAVLVAAVSSCLAGAWIGHAGGQVRHAEFRSGPPPPVNEADEHEHDD